MSARHRLDVWLYGRLAGSIVRKAGTLTFAYSPEYRAADNATPLSLSMRLAQTRHTTSVIEAYLRGLLPDNDDVLRRWAHHYRLKKGNTFSLVAAIGSDAAGGALYLPADTTPADLSGTLQPVTDAQLARRLRRLHEDGAAWIEDDEHWSLAGAQSKFTLHALDDGWALPHGAEPSTHIIKPGISRLPGQALVEHVTMRAMASLGLQVAASRYVELEDQPAIILERYDRLRRDDQLVRVHQEDLVQSFALDPSRKYEADRGPGVAKISQLLREVTSDDSHERFVRALLLNYLLGAPDAHAKNYSVLLVGRTVSLAPVYDAASGLPYTRADTLRYPRGAMSLGGERAFGEVEERHWDKLATAVQLPAALIRAWVTEYLPQVPDAVSDAIKQVPSTASDRTVLTDLLLPRVAHLAALTRTGLSGTRRVRGRIVRPAAEELASITTPDKSPPRS